MQTKEKCYGTVVTGGNPILANGKGLFNDMLGNSLGVAEKDKFTSIKRDAFGKTLENPAGNAYNMFTGKPQIGGLGYAFLFRNYRPNLGKWQTQDPLGYPDGWNNLAYCNNRTTNSIDWLGGEIISFLGPGPDGYEWYTGSITHTVREVYELVFMSSNSGSTGAGQNLTITAVSNITHSTAQSNTVSLEYSGGGLSTSGSITSTSSTTILNGATGSTTIGENSSATVSLYQKKKKIYYDYIYIAPTRASEPTATPVTGSYYAGSYMTSMYVTKVTE